MIIVEKLLPVLLTLVALFAVIVLLGSGLTAIYLFHVGDIWWGIFAAGIFFVFFIITSLVGDTFI